MEHCAGLDESLDQTSVCIIDVQGEVVRETKVVCDPNALILFLCRKELEIAWSRQTLM